MDNNELDNYFKENSHRFDEQPGADLWAKIEGGLNAAPAPGAGKTMGKGGLFSGKALFLLVIGVLVIGLIVMFFIPTEANVKVEKHSPVEQTEVQPSVSHIEKQELIVDSIPVKVNAIVQERKPVTVVGNVLRVDTLKQIIQPVAVAKVQLPEQEVRRIKVSVQESAKRTVITIREKISQQKFDSITAASLEQYKDKAGMQLIIKSFQGYIYRYTFPAAGKLLVRGSNADTIKPRINNPKINLTAVLKPVSQSLAVDSTVFEPKYDSVTGAYYIQYGTKSGDVEQEPVYTAQLTVQPEFPGGATALIAFINKTFRYPQIGKDLNAKVHVSFIIETDGSISNIKVLKEPGYGLGAEAVRVLKLLTTQWQPGEVKGKAVRTAYFMPITIKIK
jgi:hypothetical protein